MNNTSSDIFIIGGGINGVGIAADAAGRGLSVTLCEKDDLASGTSSSSSKLIHGGLRYLTTFDFGLVRKALQEREILLRNAPHLIWPLEFILPHAKHLRPTWMIRLGLFIYDHLARHPQLPNSKKINLTKNKRGEPLQSDITTGFSYYDCYDDDARLVVTNAIAAKEHGAKILTRTTCLSANFINDRWVISIKNNLSHETTTHYATVLINAAGPWVQGVQDHLIQSNTSEKVELVKGSHIILPKLYDGNHAYILQNSDERVVFAIPYEHDFTLVGTTDVSYAGDLDQVNITPEEENYLCESINNYFKKSISSQDILWSYAGVRCLQTDKTENASKITRDYKFTLTKTTPLVTIVSGKITTYRRISEEVVNALKCFFPQMKSAWTARATLPGGDIPNGNFINFYKKLCETYSWLPPELVHRYARYYGTRAEIILQKTKSLNDLGKHIGGGLYQKEIDYLVREEWAETSEDILWRRTKLGLRFTTEEIENLERVLAK